MPGESQRTPDTTPDPTVYVQAAIDRAARSEREWVLAQLAILIQRFNSNDEATRVLSDTINRTPTEIQKEVGHLKELTQSQLMEIRTELASGLQARRDMVNLQTDCSDKAIAKQEASVTKQIDALAILLQKNTDTLSDRINDNKTRIDRIEAGKLGGTEQRGDSRAAMAFAITVGFFVLAIIGFIITQVATAPGP